MSKIKISDLREVEIGLKYLGNQPLINWHDVAKNTKKATKPLKEKTEMQTEALEKYADLNEDGKVKYFGRNKNDVEVEFSEQTRSEFAEGAPIYPKFSNKENKKLYEKAIKDIEADVVEIDFHKIPKDRFIGADGKLIPLQSEFQVRDGNKVYSGSLAPLLELVIIEEPLPEQMKKEPVKKDK